MSEKFASIYALCDPRLNDPIQHIRYVGKTSRTIQHRARKHISEARQGRKSYVSNWIRSLLRLNLEPQVLLLATVGQKHDGAKEKEEILKLRFLGARLTNTTDGGEGVCGFKRSRESIEKQAQKRRGVKETQEQKRARTEATRRNWAKPEYRKRMLRALNGAWRGRKHSRETRKNLSLKAKGRIISEQQRRDISKTLTGRKLSAAHREAIGKGVQRHYCDPTNRQKSSARMNRRYSKPEERLKTSIASKKAWQRRT